MTAGVTGPRAAARTVAVGFVLTGIVSVMLGPIIPELRLRWQVSPSAVASLFVAQFVASSIGAVLSSLDLRRSLVAGYALIAAGVALLAAGGWELARVAMAAAGFGLGLVIAASNLWMAHLDPSRRGANLATLNLLWGVGAVSCPLLFTAVRGPVPLGALLGVLALVAAVCAALLWGSLPGAPALPGGRGVERPDGGAGRRKALALAPLAATFFVYVGAENAVAGWLVTLADELASERALASLLIASGFWGALLAGRAATPWVLRATTERSLLRGGLVLALAGTAVLVLSSSPPAAAAGALMTGLGMAPLFPLNVSVLAAATAATRSRRGGWVLACGGLGGAALPWLTGQVAGEAGTLRQGFLVPLAGLVVLVLLDAARGAADAA